MGKLILKKSMVSDLTERQIIHRDTPISELVGVFGLPEPLEAYLNVSLDGEHIPREAWAATMAGNKSVVHVTVVPGKKTLKKLLPIIAIIAIAVVAPAAAAAIAPSLGITSAAGVSVLAAGIMFVGALAVNALFPPPSPENLAANALPSFGAFGGGFGGGGSLGGSSGSTGDASGYHVTGIRNQTRPHSAIRNIYGTRKVGPDLAAENLVLTNGDIQTLYSVFDFGYGDIDVEDIRIGNTPIGQYEGAQVKIHKNYTSGPLTYYKNDHTTDSHAVELRFDPVVRAAPDSASNEVVIEVLFPLGLGWFDGEKGGFNRTTAGLDITFKNTNSGAGFDLYNPAISAHFSHSVKRESGDKTFSITRKTKHPFSLAITAIMPSADPWEVTIHRNSRWKILYDRTDDSKDSNLDKTVLASIRSVTYQNPLNFRTPHTILEMRLTATDQLSGAIDTLTCIAHRKIRHWNAGWKAPIRTSNPAWVAADILTGPANPDPIKDARIDFQSFLDWAQFCDRTAPNAAEPYYKCDINWDGASTVYEALMAVLSSGRATLTMRNNKYAVVYERFPTTPVQMFTPRNSWDFGAAKKFTKTPHALKMGFIDPDSDWQKQEILVYADGYNQGNADYFEGINLPLVTRSTQAWRDGRYYLAQGILRPELFTITVDVENLVAERGDLVTVQYDVSKMGGIPARIKSIIGNDLILDDEVIWDNQKQWRVRIRYQDGTQAEFDVTGQPDSNRMTLSAAPSLANVGDLIVFGERDLVVDEMLIKTVSPAEDLTATLELVPIARAIETADQGPIPPYAPPISNDDMFIPACLAVAVEQTLYYDARYPFIDIALSWPAVGSNVQYEIWVKTDNDFELNRRVTNERTLLFDKQSTIDAQYPAGETISVKVLPINVFGYKPAFGACPAVDFIAAHDITAPGRPQFMAGNINKQTIALTWLPPSDQDIGGFILKYTPDLDSPQWDSATIDIHLIPHDSFSAKVNARIGSYLLKTIDTSGNLSVEFALVRTTIPELDGLNVIERLDEHPTFPGILSGAEIVGADLRLENLGAEYATVGTYLFNNQVDLGAISDARIFTEVIARSVDLGGGDLVSPSDNVEIQARTANSLIVMAQWQPPLYPNNLASVIPLSDSAGAVWSGWQRLTAGNYTGRYFEFRAILSTDDTQVSPAVSLLSVSVDIEDRIESGHDIISTVGGSRHRFLPSFMAPPAVALTGEHMKAGDYYILSNIAHDGFDIEFFNQYHHSIEARYDYIAKGYGKRLHNIYPAIEAGHEDDIATLPDAISLTRQPNILQ